MLQGNKQGCMVSQAALVLVVDLGARGAGDEKLARMLFPLLVIGDVRHASPSVKACAVLALGHFGASCAKSGCR
jgi:hypothetical protein